MWPFKKRSNQLSTEVSNRLIRQLVRVETSFVALSDLSDSLNRVIRDDNLDTHDTKEKISISLDKIIREAHVLSILTKDAKKML